MQNYEAENYDIPELSGISKAQIDAHLKLYQGYVAHTNTIQEKIKDLSPETDSYLIQELGRRYGFEFDGMRLHEYYFGALEGSASEFDADSAVGKAIVAQFGSYEKLVEVLTHCGMTRGSGWALLYFDPRAEQFIIHWADEHHLGHLATLPVVLALDCWEHAYMIDHDTTGRKQYIADYLANINWKTVNEWFENCQ